MNDLLLKASALSCERDDRLLFGNLDFEVRAGDIVHLEGPNGAGKTTLLRIIAGLYGTYEGELQWRGEPIQRCRALFNSEMLFLGHKSGIKRTLTPIENLTATTSLNDPAPEFAMYDALKEVGLAGYEHVPCAHLSAGQHRRVALARLYLSHADIWVLDEMFTAIDKAGVAKLENFLAAEASKGRAIVLTTHHHLDIEAARTLSLGQFAGGARH